MKERKIPTFGNLTHPDNLSKDTGKKKFQSVTRIFLDAQKSATVFCPHCGSALNFEIAIEWMGPEAFLCGSCDRLLHMSLIHRALRDLGVE